MMTRTFLTSLILLWFTSGCGKGNSDDVAALREEVGKLRQEVDVLKSRAYDPRRVERRAFAKDAGLGPKAEVSRQSANVAESTAADQTRQTRERIQRPTPEELRARHEAMRDPEKRAELRAEHKARMEEHKVRMEERRKRMEERRQQRRNGEAESRTDISNQQKQN